MSMKLSIIGNIYYIIVQRYEMFWNLCQVSPKVWWARPGCDKL